MFPGTSGFSLSDELLRLIISIVGSGEKVLIHRLSKTPSRYCDITLSARQHPRIPELNFGGTKSRYRPNDLTIPSAKTGI